MIVLLLGNSASLCGKLNGGASSSELLNLQVLKTTINESVKKIINRLPYMFLLFSPSLCSCVYQQSVCFLVCVDLGVATFFWWCNCTADIHQQNIYTRTGVNVRVCLFCLQTTCMSPSHFCWCVCVCVCVCGRLYLQRSINELIISPIWSISC